jgi:PAS domain S-box-containing protein
MSSTSGKPQRLGTTLDAVREVMAKRLENGSLEEDERRDVEMALEELDVMWEELQGQTAALEQEASRYAEFFEHAPEAYLVTDAGGSVREANLAARELLGANPVGRPLVSFVPEGERTHFFSMFLKVADRPRPQSWRGAIGAAAVEFTVREIPLRKSTVAGLCWLVRPL